jgi:hypothetical protein
MSLPDSTVCLVSERVALLWMVFLLLTDDWQVVDAKVTDVKHCVRTCGSKLEFMEHIGYFLRGWQI